MVDAKHCLQVNNNDSSCRTGLRYMYNIHGISKGGIYIFQLSELCYVIFFYENLIFIDIPKSYSSSLLISRNTQVKLLWYFIDTCFMPLVFECKSYGTWTRIRDFLRMKFSIYRYTNSCKPQVIVHFTVLLSQS